jgi:hypothetical protein
MTKLISFLFALTALACPISAMAEELTFTEGEPLQHMLSVCVEKQDAIDIVKADAEKGFEAATAVWLAKGNCLSLPVVNAFVGKVVYSAPAKRGDKEVTSSVVEIVSEGRVVAYFLTTAPVKKPTRGVDGKALNLKPERNA